MTVDTLTGGLTATQCAEECGVSRQTIHAWFKEGLAKKPTRSQVMYFLANRNTQTTGSMRERITKAQAMRLERENRKEDGEVIEADEVRRVFLQAIALFSQDFNALPQRITTDETIQAKAEDEVRKARDRFAEHLVALAADEGAAETGVDGREGKAKKVTRRVGRRRKGAAARNSRARTVAKQSDPVLPADLQGAS